MKKNDKINNKTVWTSPMSARGITLIALVITIIVLLILAGVTMQMLIGKNGILNGATNSVIETYHSIVKEQIILGANEYKIEEMQETYTGNVIEYLKDKEYTEDKTDYYRVKVEKIAKNIKKGKGQTKEAGDIYLIEKKTNTEYVLRYYETVDKSKDLLVIDLNGKTGVETPAEDTRTVLEQATAAMPEGAHIDTSTNENTGIVMIDSKENEWVWIEVPKEVFTRSTSKEDYENIKADLIEYARDYTDGYIDGYADKWYDRYGTTYDGENEYSKVGHINSVQTFSNVQEYYGTIYKDNTGTEIMEGWGGYYFDSYYAKITDKLNDTSACGLTYDEYNVLYQRMLSSIYENKGFYISRYEIGDKESTENNEVRKNGGITNTPVSRIDQIPYNYVTCSQAQGLASSMTTGGKTSSLLFGIQWDLVCKFLEEKSDLSLDNIKSNSTSWGNYWNSSFTLSRGKYLPGGSKYSNWKAYNIDTEKEVENSTKLSNEGYYVLLTTGASEYTNKMNIYDFAGNEWEWTLEFSNNPWAPSMRRGGNFIGNGGAYWASDRQDAFDGTSKDYGYIGFRASLY